MFEGASKAELKRMAERGQRAMSYAKNLKEKAEEGMEIFLQTAEVNAAAFGFAYARGYFTTKGKKFEVFGVSPDVLAGMGLHALAFFGMFGKHYRHAHNLADGCFASYVVTKGVQFGVEGATKAATATTSGEVHSLPVGGGAGLSDAQLAELIRRAA